tara:strand:+ start:500 stop:715 length:216 start_codon:yes stop_codon:yes gene_type:complete
LFEELQVGIEEAYRNFQHRQRVAFVFTSLKNKPDSFVVYFQVENSQHRVIVGRSWTICIKSKENHFIITVR